MLKFLIDENISRRRNPHIDVVRVQDVDLRETPDPEILEYAARENRIVVTQDVTTMTAYAYRRIGNGLPMPGLLEIPDGAPFVAVLEDLLLIAECGSPFEFEGRVEYLPL